MINENDDDSEKTLVNDKETLVNEHDINHKNKDTNDINSVPNRPNANYKLSKSDSGKDPYGEDRLVFHYNRQKRLDSASQTVKDLYDTKKTPRGGIFRVLIADKPRAMIFMAIVVICVSLLILSIFGRQDNSYTIDGNKIEIVGAKYEDITIVILRKTIKKKNQNFFTGEINIGVTPSSNDGTLPFFHKIFFTMEPEEEYRFVVPFDQPQLTVTLQTEKSSINIKFKPE